MAKPRLPRVGPVNPASHKPAFPKARCTVSVQKGSTRGVNGKRKSSFVPTLHEEHPRTAMDRGVISTSVRGEYSKPVKRVGVYPMDAPKKYRKVG